MEDNFMKTNINLLITINLTSSTNPYLKKYQNQQMYVVFDKK